MIRWVRGWWERVVMWWSLTGQFSRPVRLISPRRRAVRAQAEAIFTEPGYREASRARLAEAIQRQSLGAGALALLDEAELVRGIFGQDMGEGPARE